jgi:hypothetical protein
LEETQQSLSSPPSQFKGIQQIEERGKEIHLPIINRSQKINIPLMRGIRKLQMVCHNSLKHAILYKSKNLGGLIPTPHIMPESNLEHHPSQIYETM